MENNPLISVIIPTYNRRELLKETIDSILTQTYKWIELIIISDASTDGTEYLIGEYNDPRIKFVQLQTNKKYPSVVRNIGATYAKGEFIAFCDDDDIWNVDKLEFQIQKLIDNSELLLIGTNGRFFPGYKINIFQNRKDFIISYEELLRTNYLITSSVLMRKSIFEELGGFDEDPRIHIGEDYDLWLRVIKLKNNSILFVSKPFVFYRIGNIKIMNTYQDVNNYFDRQLYIYNKHLPLAESFVSNLQKRSAKNINEVAIRQVMSNISLKLYSKECSIWQVLTDKRLNLRGKMVVLGKFFVKLMNQINKV